MAHRAGRQSTLTVLRARRSTPRLPIIRESRSACDTDPGRLAILATGERQPPPRRRRCCLTPRSRTIVILQVVPTLLTNSQQRFHCPKMAESDAHRIHERHLPPAPTADPELLLERQIDFSLFYSLSFSFPHLILPAGASNRSLWCAASV